MQYDLTEYSDNELSLLVFNDQFLYRRRFLHVRDDYESLGFKFTESQWEVLQDDLEEDREETNE